MSRGASQMKDTGVRRWLVRIVRVLGAGSSNAPLSLACELGLCHSREGNLHVVLSEGREAAGGDLVFCGKSKVIGRDLQET